jgi:hypothetical protein
MIIKVLGTSINPGGALQGATGQRGAIWYIYNGAGTPAAGTFVGELDGDWAIRKSDGENFERVNGLWVDQGFTNRSTAATTAAKGYRTTAYTLTSQQWQVVPMNGVVYDAGGNFNLTTGRFVCPVSGYYQINGEVLASSSAGAIVGVAVNATVPYQRGSIGAYVGNPINSYAGVISDVIQCNAGDTIGLACYPNAADGIQTGAGGAFLSVALITAGTGPQGARGNQWWTYAGTGTPASTAFPTAIVNDLAVRTSDTEVFALTASGWVDQGYKAGGSIASTPVVAKARRGSSLAVGGGWVKVPLDTLIFDSLGSIVQTANGRMVVPYTGYYQVSAQMGEAATELLLYLAVNGAIDAAPGIRGTRTPNTPSNTANGVLTGTIPLNAGDILEMYVWTPSATTLTCFNADVSWFSLAMIQPGVGPQGTRWNSYGGTGTPPANTFTGETDGDMAIRTSDSEVFKRVSGAWVDQNWKMAAGVNQVAVGARMYRSAAYTPAANAWVKIPLDTVSFDTTGAGMASAANGRVNILFDGLYQIDANVFQNVSATGTYTNYGVQVLKNGTTVLQSYSGPAVATYAGMVGSDKVQCKAGDYIELYIASSQSAALNTGPYTNYLSVALISAGPGPQGQRGSNWFTYTGAGTPAAGTFTGELDGDMAVRASDGEVFKRITGAWVDQNWKQSTGMATMDIWHFVGNTGEPAFVNGWVNYGSGYGNASFRKFPDGKVKCAGLIRAGTIPSTIFTLPPGYRPNQNQIYGSASNDVFGEMRVNTDGTVATSISNNGWVTLDDIEFDTGTVTNYAVGTRGSNWFAYGGAGAPPTPSFTGEIDNDMAVRTSDSEVFKRVAGVWTDQSYKAGSNLTTMPATVARAWLAGAFTTNNTWQKVPLDTLSFDVSSNLWDATNKRFVCPTAGVYHVDANLAWGASTWAGRMILSVYKNGTEVLRTDEYRSSDGSDYRTLKVSDKIRCNSGDVLELWAYTAVGFSAQPLPPIGISGFLAVGLMSAGTGPQGPPGPGPGGAVQRNYGKYVGYSTMSGTANFLDGAGGGGAGSPLVLTVTPTVPSWWEVNFMCANLLALTAAYYYTQLTMALSPADLDGVSASDGPVITQHSQVQQYEGRTYQRIFRLAANQAYTITPALATNGGSFQYYTAPTHLWIEGKLWPQ